MCRSFATFRVPGGVGLSSYLLDSGVVFRSFGKGLLYFSATNASPISGFPPGLVLILPTIWLSIASYCRSRCSGTFLALNSGLLSNQRNSQNHLKLALNLHAVNHTQSTQLNNIPLILITLGWITFSITTTDVITIYFEPRDKLQKIFFSPWRN